MQPELGLGKFFKKVAPDDLMQLILGLGKLLFVFLFYLFIISIARLNIPFSEIQRN